MRRFQGFSNPTTSEVRSMAMWVGTLGAMVTALGLTTVGVALVTVALPARAGDGPDNPWQMWTDWQPPDPVDVPHDAGLTDVLLWAPDGSVEFKTAAACHLPRYDYYAVYAAFTVEQPDGGFEDELWYLLVDGLSWYHEYGNVVVSSRVATEEVISQVACADDDHTTSFAAWDRSDDPFDSENLHWARVSLFGAVTEFDTVGDCHGRTSWAPGIAYVDDPSMGELVAISSAPRADCNHCWTILDAGTGAQLSEHTDFASAIGTTTRATAIVDSGDGGWLMAWLAWVDGSDSGHPAAIFARRIARDGDGAWGDLTPIWDSGATRYSDAPDHIDLVAPGADDDGHFLIQTFLRAAWIDSAADVVTPSPFWPFNPTEDGPYDHAVSCAYAGDDLHRLATSFRETSSGRTHRRHWPRNPWASVTRGEVDGIYRVPVTCSATPDTDDPEVLLVRAYPKPSNPAADHLYFNLQPAD